MEQLANVLSDGILAIVSASLGAFIGYALAARMYEKKVAHLEGRVVEQESRLNVLMESLNKAVSGLPNADGSA